MVYAKPWGWRALVYVSVLCLGVPSASKAQEEHSRKSVGTPLPKGDSPSLDASPVAKPSVPRAGMVSNHPPAHQPDIARMGSDASSGVQVIASIDKTEFRQLERVRVNAEIKNISYKNHGLPFSFMNRYRLARIQVFDSDGNVVSKTQFYAPGVRAVGSIGGSLGGGTMLQPGAAIREEFVPNLLYDMTNPGEYWVLIEIPVLDLPKSPGESGIRFARAKPLQVRVLPEPATAPGLVVPAPD